MSKLDKLRRDGGSAAAESMGAGVSPIPGVSATGPAPVPAHLQGVAKAKNVALIPVAKIGPDPDQPREEFDPEALERLAESLRTRGQLQPIRVRWDEGRGSYVIVCGERRWRAAEVAGLSTLSCVIMDGPVEPSELLAIQLVENCLREDLKPIEQARAFRSLMDRNGWSTRDLARELAMVQPQVVRTLSLLDLPAPIQERVEQGALAAATAYEISKVANPAEQAELAERVVSEGLTRAETVAAVKASKPSARAKGKASRTVRKVTSQVLKTTQGPRVTVEFKRGLDDALIRAALLDALGQVEARLSGSDQEAA